MLDARIVILHFTDGTQHKVVVDSSNQDCKVNNIPRGKRIAKAEVASGDFILYSKRTWSGRQKVVGSGGNRDYSADVVGFTKVKSVQILKEGCSREANVPLVAVSVCAVVLALALAALLLYRKFKKTENNTSRIDSLL